MTDSRHSSFELSWQRLRLSTYRGKYLSRSKIGINFQGKYFYFWGSNSLPKLYAKRSSARTSFQPFLYNTVFWHRARQTDRHTTKCEVIWLRLLRSLMFVLRAGEQNALAFTPEQYLVTERHTGNVCLITDDYLSMGGSVADWLTCWTQAQKGPGSNRSHNAVG